MTEVGIAFEVLEAGQGSPVSWRKATGHLVLSTVLKRYSLAVCIDWPLSLLGTVDLLPLLNAILMS